MADRQVKRTGKDSDGDITSLCGDWGSASKAVAISDIDSRLHSYFVNSGRGRTDIVVVQGATGKYLRTNPDSTTGDNLDNLPDC